jgi:hypothetical protein
MKNPPWEIITQRNRVIKRGIADTEPAACQQAGDAAREAHLIE